MLYTYIVPGYALSFIFSILAVLFFLSKKSIHKILALILLVLSLSIYQAYIAISASLIVLRLMQMVLCDEKSVGQILRDGIGGVLLLILALGIYYGITKVMMQVQGIAFNKHAEDRVLTLAEVFQKLPQDIIRAYIDFVKSIFGRVHVLVLTRASVIVHLLSGGMTAVLLVLSIRDCYKNGVSRCALLLFLLAILPLSIECLYLFAPKGVRELTQYSFIAVYILAVMIVEMHADQIHALCRDVVAISLVIVLATNIYAANRVYLRVYLEYENTYSTCQAVTTQIEMTPGFEEGDKIALIGSIEGREYLENFRGMSINGVSDVRNAYSRNKFFTYYLGMNFQFASDEEIEVLKDDPRVAAMSHYPYYGYVQKIDDYIVVKLGED